MKEFLKFIKKTPTAYHAAHEIKKILISNTKLKQDTFKSFIANSMLMKICELKKEEYKEYLKQLRKDKVASDLLTNTTGRKIKKLIVKISPRFYYEKLSK